MKDSLDYSTGHVNLQYDEGGETLTYRPRWSDVCGHSQDFFIYRKFYTIDLEQSVDDPDKTIRRQFLIFHSSLGLARSGMRDG